MNLQTKIILNKFYKYSDTIVKVKKITKNLNKIYVIDLTTKEEIIMPYEGAELIMHRIYTIGEVAKTTYVAVLFTAEYGPPCQAFEKPFFDFEAAMNKDSHRMQVVVVNCDKRRKEYDLSIAKMPARFLSVPF